MDTGDVSRSEGTVAEGVDAVGATAQAVAAPPDGPGSRALRLLSPRAGEAHRAVGLLLVVLWVAWVVVTAVVQPRTVWSTQLDEDLAAGKVVAWRVVSLVDDAQDWRWADHQDLNIPSADRLGNPDDLGDVPGTLAIAYWTDDTVARTRIVGPGAVPSVEETTAMLRAAGVPPAWEAGPGVVDEPARDSGVLPALAACALFLLALLFGPPPARGTRWFWFWFLFPTFGVGVLLYAVLEHLRPPTAQVRDRARRRGIHGLGFSILLGFATLLVATMLVDSTGWVWPIQP